MITTQYKYPYRVENVEFLISILLLLLGTLFLVFLSVTSDAHFAHCFSVLLSIAYLNHYFLGWCACAVFFFYLWLRQKIIRFCLFLQILRFFPAVHCFAATALIGDLALQEKEEATFEKLARERIRRQLRGLEAEGCKWHFGQIWVDYSKKCFDFGALWQYVDIVCTLFVKNVKIRWKLVFFWTFIQVVWNEKI